MSALPPEPPAACDRWYCGSCAGRGWLWCSDCVAGCKECQKVGKVRCWQCEGGPKTVPPPDWI